MNKYKDKYYTNQAVVNNIIKIIKTKIKINNNDLCIEPSAGNGSFIDPIKSLFNHYKLYDLYPEHKDIIKQNFLTLNTDNFIKQFNNIHMIGNPPFGRKSSLVIKFIKKSCKFCNSFSFILPKSFKKQSMQRCIPLNFHLIYSYNLPSDSFILNNKPYDVNCVFQIWIKKDKPRKIPKKLFPNHYKFVPKTENPDISIRRVGYNAGKVDFNYKDKSIQSHYFIKFDSFNSNLLKKIKNINFHTKHFTLGPKSISKQELIKKLNSIS